MAQFNGQPFSSTKNINVKNGLIRFGSTNSSNLIGSSDYGLYVNSSGSLIFSSAGSITTIGAAGAGSGVTTWDGLYSNDKTLTISSTTLTFDGTHASNDVLTITSTGAGTGSLIQITNAGTGKDIRGDSGTWSVSKVGDAVFNLITAAGDAGSNSITLTAGDVQISDGSINVVDADNAFTLKVTNDTATTASVIVFAGSGAFTGNTTSSFMTVTPSGLTTGTAIYVPLAALTTGKGLSLVADAVTDGLVLNITSSSTVHTATGRLLNISSTAGTNTSAVLNEIATAATDETVLLRLTASDVLAAGKLLHFNASTMATGTAIDMAALDGLTTGIGLSVASTSTTLTTGSLIRASTATTGAVATNGVVSIRGTGAHTSTSNAGLLDVQSSGMVGTAANSTLVNFKATGAAQVDTTLLNVEASGFTTGYTGTMVRIKSPSTTGSGTIVGVIADGITSGGTAMDISTDALTTGIALNIANSGGAMTTGSLIRVAAQGTGAIATNGIVSFSHTGAFTSNSATDGGFVEIKANDTTAGVVLNLVADALTTGVGVHVSNGSSAVTTGSLLRVTTGGTGAIATNGVVSFTHTGDFTSTSATNGGFVEIKANDTTAGTAVNIVADALTTGLGMHISNGSSAMTTGSLLRVTAGGTGAIATNGLVSFTHTGDFTSTSAVNGGFVEIKANDTTAGTVFNLVADALTTGIGMQLSNATSAMTTGSLLRVTTSGAGTIATNGIVSVTHAGVYASTSNAGLLDVRATAATGTATVVNFMSTAAAQTDVTVLNVENSGFTTGYTGSMLRIKSPTTTGACKVVELIADGMTSGGTAFDITVDALTTGTGLSITNTGGVMTTTGELLLVSSTAATTCTGLIRVSGAGLTDGFAMELTGGGANATATGGVVNIIAGAATDGAALKVGTTGTYIGTVGVLDINAASATSGNIVTIDGTGLTTGTALLINATTATLTSGFYIRCNDGAATDFSVGDFGATVIAGSALGTAALTISAGDIVLTSGNINVGGKVIFSATETIAAGGTSTALDLTKTVHYVDADAGGDTFTLADGIAGQIMTILLTSSTGTATITPANLAGGTSVTLNADGDSVVLQFMDTEWFILGGNSYTVV